MTITAGMTSSSFDVDIIDNKLQEDDKMFTITIGLISTCLPMTIKSNTTTVTIIDNEGTTHSNFCFNVYLYCCFPPLVLRVQFTSDSFSGSESSGEILVTINITGGTPSVAISIDISYMMLNTTG